MDTGNYYDTFDRVVNSAVMLYLVETKDTDKVIIENYMDTSNDRGVLYSLLIGNDLQNKTIYVKGFKNYRMMKETLEERAQVKWGNPLFLLWNKHKIAHINLFEAKKTILKRTDFQQEVPLNIYNNLYELIYEEYYQTEQLTFTGNLV